MHMGEPLIKFDYVIVSLSPTCAFYRLHLLLSLSFFFISFPFSLKKKKKLGKTDAGVWVGRLCSRRGVAGGPQLSGAGMSPRKHGGGGVPAPHSALAKAAAVGTKPVCSRTGLGLTPGSHSLCAGLECPAGRARWLSTCWWGSRRRLTARLACRQLPGPGPAQGMPEPCHPDEP